jgi:hypothetical protein
MRIAAIFLPSVLLANIVHISNGFAVLSPAKLPLQSALTAISRRQVVVETIKQFTPAAVLLGTSSLPVRADVSDGNALPQGAQQFARVLRLKTNLKVRIVFVRRDLTLCRDCSPRGIMSISASHSHALTSRTGIFENRT